MWNRWLCTLAVLTTLAVAPVLGLGSGHFYTKGTDEVVLDSAEPVEFDVSLTTAAFTHTPGTSPITIEVAGRYAAIYNTMCGLSATAWALYLDDGVTRELLPGSTYESCDGHVIFDAAAGDILEFQNDSPYTQGLAGSTSETVILSLQLVQLSVA